MQITGVLRNLAVSPAHAPAFLAAGALPAFKQAMRQLGGTQELALNLGRVLSKLSLSEQCQVSPGAQAEAPALRLPFPPLRQQVQARIQARWKVGLACPLSQAEMEADAEYAPLLVSLLGRYVANGPMLIRLAFAIGNLTTTSDGYRMQASRLSCWRALAGARGGLDAVR